MTLAERVSSSFLYVPPLENRTLVCRHCVFRRSHSRRTHGLANGLTGVTAFPRSWTRGELNPSLVRDVAKRLATRPAPRGITVIRAGVNSSRPLDGRGFEPTAKIPPRERVGVATCKASSPTRVMPKRSTSARHPKRRPSSLNQGRLGRTLPKSRRRFRAVCSRTRGGIMSPTGSSTGVDTCANRTSIRRCARGNFAGFVGRISARRTSIAAAFRAGISR